MTGLDLVMQGEIRAVSDMAVSPPQHSKKEAGRSTVLLLPEKRIWHEGYLRRTVYLPASTLRGALRNTTAQAIARDRLTRGGPLTPEEYLLLAKGGIKDRKAAGADERVVDYRAAAALRRSQPLVSLFGAMRHKLAGRWQIGDAVPAEPLGDPVRKGQGARSHPFQRQPELGRLMDEAQYRAFLEKDAQRVEANLAESEARRLAGRIAAEQARPEPKLEQIAKWEGNHKKLAARAERLREAAGGVVNVQQPLGGWDAIPQGTRMHHAMRIREATEDELAMAFFALRQLAREGRIGAHEARGEGCFEAQYALRLAFGESEHRCAGTLRLEDFCPTLDSACPVLEQAFARSATLLDAGRDPVA